ncbi:MAG: putative transport system permease protein, partial [Verrucomicrobiota bacterium]
MKTPLAWRNVAQSKVRSLVALGGVSFAILLIFMQLGFQAAAKTSATSVHEALDFDILVLSPHYVFIARSGQFPRSRLEQVRAMKDVESVTPVWMATGEWRSLETQERWNIFTLAVDPGQRPFREQAVNDQLPLLTVPDNALSDLRSRPEHGPLTVG